MTKTYGSRLIWRTKDHRNLYIDQMDITHIDNIIARCLNGRVQDTKTLELFLTEKRRRDEESRD